MPISDKNPFSFDEVKSRIDASLSAEFAGKYEVISVPNITNIFYGRGVGYKIEYIDLPAEIQEISATKIRAEMAE
jgi:hypothetical protein